MIAPPRLQCLESDVARMCPGLPKNLLYLPPRIYLKAQHQSESYFAAHKHMLLGQALVWLPDIFGPGLVPLPTLPVDVITTSASLRSE